MDKKQTGNLMNFLIRLSWMLILLGAFLRISHYPIANLILTIGFVSGGVFSYLEISRLNKIIKQLEDEKTGSQPE